MISLCLQRKITHFIWYSHINQKKYRISKQRFYHFLLIICTLWITFFWSNIDCNKSIIDKTERFLRIWNTFLSNKPCKSTHFTSLFARYCPIIQNCIKRTRWYTFPIHFLLHNIKPKYYNSTFNPNRSLDRFGTTRDWKDINWQKQQRPLLIVLDEPLKIKIKSFKRLSGQNNKNIILTRTRAYTL